MKIVKFLFLSLCWLAVGTVSGEETSHDGGMWINVSVSPKMPHNWSMIYSIEHRSKENFSRTSLWSGTANAWYHLNSWFSLGAGYEFFLNREKDGAYTPEYRYYPAVLLSFRKGLFSGSFRSYLMNTFTQWKDPHWEFRNKLKVAYKWKGTRLKPFVAAEPYHRIYPVNGCRFGKIRYFAGLSCGFGRHHQLDVYYLHEKYRYKPLINHVAAIDYNFSF